MITVTDQDLERIRSSEGLGGTLREALLRRADQWTATPGLTSPDSSMEWWHLAWERIADVAIAARLEPTDARESWLHDEVLRIVALETDEWLGPFFRIRSDPPVGALETAHVTIAVCTAASLAPQVFDDSEHEAIRAAVRDKGLILCDRFLERVEGLPSSLDRAVPRRHLNNWAMVLLNGFGTAATFLGDESAVERAVELYEHLAGLFNEDSYGESLQYWNYAVSHLAHLREVLVTHDPGLDETLNLSRYTRCIPWVVHSHLYLKPLSGWGHLPLPRVLNFGDCAVTFRPTADVLLHIAARAKTTHPTEAGLARWLFDTTYAHPEAGRDEGESFGFSNTFKWAAILLLLDAADPLSPQEAGLDLGAAFSEGTAVVRDRWEAPTTVLGVHGSHAPLRVQSHRHADQNSFILTHRGERLFADPGHCCYRLQTHWTSTEGASHNTWTFTSASGELAQRKANHSEQFASRAPHIQWHAYACVITSDVAGAYPESVTTAQRTWITSLPHAVVIIDRIGATEPIDVTTHFVLNNRDGLLVVDEEELFTSSDQGELRMTVRRCNAGLQLVRVLNRGDSLDLGQRPQRRWGFMHDLYHPQPNQPGQGREGSASIYDLTTEEPALSYTAIYALILDLPEALGDWSVDGVDDGYLRIAQGGENHLEVRFDDSWSPVEINTRGLGVHGGMGS